MLRWSLLVGLVISVAGATAVRAESTTPAHTRTLYLIRHGAYDTATPGDEELSANSLTNLGVAQAKLTAARLKAMPVTFTAIFASTMTRARQTAAIIAEAFPSLTVQPAPLLRECTPRTRRADIMAGRSTAALDAAEAQLNEAFARYFVPARQRDENDILVCHGNAIRYLVTKALGVDTQAWLGMSVAHCSVTVIQVTPTGAFRVLAVGDIGHVPAPLQSGWSATNPELEPPHLPDGAATRT